ncbi:MBL fold metallo-hydrolase [Candidatus Uabimicrobium amorphum]|uniref:MBL fold metallo-hydrolase n=1 Tax=Uabimicrobium amorphum TaxID=2596890 RepID=A0A5S9IM77_UABAM|nr:MBL fold metallo-hydrolase [Candidatus Uabimicrobium amorphum]BBM83610.1 MBL fold metallo-hydrolase [Candidatus Uabimicrobium amorphum]
MQIANYQLHIVETGRFGLDGGAMFGVVPKVLWNRTNPADEKNRISLAMRTLLLVGEGRVILIDTGVGDYWPQKFCNIYAIDHDHSSLVQSLEKLGYTPNDVTDVIVTHLHFDHVGGAVRLEGQQHVPLFSNAKYHIQKSNLQHAKNPLEKDRASYLPETFMPLVENNLVEVTDGEKELLPNIHVLPVDGHTIGQQMVKISDNSDTLLYCADLIPTSSHIPIPYVMAYDLSPVKTIEEKKKYLQLACDNNWLLYFEHDPQIATVTVTKNTKGFIADKTMSNFS